MQVSIYSAAGDKQTSITVSPSVFDKPFNEPLVHQVITASLSNRRAGTHAQKTRAEVSGGGAKPWKQKGMGRARAGTTRSPLWRHGGVTFAAKPTSYAQKINKKMYHGALRSVLSQLLRDQRLKIIENLEIKQPKTKDMVALFNKLSLVKPLIIVDAIEKNLYLATRNIPHVTVINTSAIDPVHLLTHEDILITKDALLKLNEALKDEK